MIYAMHHYDIRYWTNWILWKIYNTITQIDSKVKIRRKYYYFYISIFLCIIIIYKNLRAYVFFLKSINCIFSKIFLIGRNIKSFSVAFLYKMEGIKSVNPIPYLRVFARRQVTKKHRGHLETFHSFPWNKKYYGSSLLQVVRNYETNFGRGKTSHKGIQVGIVSNIAKGKWGRNERDNFRQFDETAENIGEMNVCSGNRDSRNRSMGQEITEVLHFLLSAECVKLAGND